jgi:hypothetical protein
MTIYNKNIAADAAIEGSKLKAGDIAQSKLAANSLDGTVVKNTAASNVIGGIPVLHVFDIADAATNDYDIVLTHKTRVVDVWAVKNGGAGGAANTVQVKNGASVISSVLDLNIADTTVARTTTLDDAQNTILAGGTLRASVVKAGGNAACTVYVSGVRSA